MKWQSLDSVWCIARVVDLAHLGVCHQVRNFNFLAQNLTLYFFLVAKKPNDIYANLLSPKRDGFALWIPEPNKNLPFSYQRKGVQIGDVGIIKPSGCFSFIFNVCVPRDHPINPRSLPEDFVPIYPSIDPIDISRFVAFKSGSFLASTSIEKSQDDTTSPYVTSLQTQFFC